LQTGMAKKIQKTKIDLYIISQVHKMRIEKDFTQEELAVHLNVSTGFIGHVESPNFRAKYNVVHLNELAKLFKCSPKDFFPERPI
jgi:transcriptional regulator with XRE-family HTH domain